MVAESDRDETGGIFPSRLGLFMAFLIDLRLHYEWVYRMSVLRFRHEGTSWRKSVTWRIASGELPYETSIDSLLSAIFEIFAFKVFARNSRWGTPRVKGEQKAEILGTSLEYPKLPTKFCRDPQG